MLSQDQIETFVTLVDDEAGIGIDEANVVSTTDTMRDFSRQWGAADEVSEGLHIWHKIQTAPGKPRRTLCVFDFGDVRAATC